MVFNSCCQFSLLMTVWRVGRSCVDIVCVLVFEGYMERVFCGARHEVFAYGCHCRMLGYF